MNEHEQLAQRFEAQRGHLRAVAYRMLGSLSEAEDAVQEAWLRLSNADRSDVENLGAWLTTVVGRICLDILRSRTVRREEPLGVYLPDPIVSREGGVDPEHEVLLADSVGLALLVVLDTLTPAERLAFVLHDVFAVPFEQIALIIGRSVAAVRQLASRGRRRVQAVPTTPDTDYSRQRVVVNAFLAAARNGNFDALLNVLDPDVVLRADLGGLPSGGSHEVHGAASVAKQASHFAWQAQFVHPARINGVAGVVAIHNGRPAAILAFTVMHERIVAIDILADQVRLSRLALPEFEE